MTADVIVDLATIPDIFALEVPRTNENVQLMSGAVMLHGWSLMNVATVPAELKIYNGNSTDGQVAGAVLLGAQDSQAIWMGVPGLFLDVGLFIQSEASSFGGAFWVSRPPQ